MNLSHPRRMLAVVRVRAVVVGVLVSGAAIAVAVYVRTMCRPVGLAWLDDLPEPPPCPGCAHGECLRACPPGTCGAIDDDEAARAALGADLDDLEPDEDDPLIGFAGAVLGLAFATDDTAARYWLAMCARRGATQEQLAELHEQWQREQRRSVTYWTTDRPEEQHP